MKRLCATVLIAVLVLLEDPTSLAFNGIDEQFTLNSNENSSGKVGILFEENVDTLRMPSLLFGYQWPSGAPANVLDFCDGLSDSDCQQADYLKYYALMPPCKSQIDVDCIESFYAVFPGSPARIKGSFKEPIPESLDRPYISNPENGLPQGSVSGIWEIPNVKHGGGSNSYAVIVSQVGSLKRSGSTWLPQPPGSDPWGSGDFRAAIYPVTIVRDARYKSNTASISKQPSGVSAIGINHPSKLPFDVCAIVGNGVCALRQPFPEKIQFGLVIRFSKVINGWMHGRIDSPEIDYEVANGQTRVDMKGFAIKVPILAGWATPEEFSTEDRRRHPFLSNSNVGVNYPGASGSYSMEMLNIWTKVLKDKAVATPTQWTFYNLPERDLQSSSSCIKDSRTLAGFVTTNSTTYTATPPVFNEESGTLDYQVASPHFLPNGDVFQGKYNLYIDSNVARCIYKFTNAPISATVSVTSKDGGQQNVATTVIRESGGWLHLSATGFTFSAPTLKVKFSQNAKDLPAIKDSSSTPAAVSKPTTKGKKMVIICYKGKLTKKVIAVSPKCPTGYKSKA